MYYVIIFYENNKNNTHIKYFKLLKRGFMNQELQFPLVYDLRVIYGGTPEDGISKVSRLLADLAIDSRDGIIKPGGKPNLSRLGFNITLLSKEQMDTLYKNLNTIPEIKWAT